MRIRRSHSRSLESRRVVLLSEYRLILNIASCHSLHILLLHNVALHIAVVIVWIFDTILIVRSIGQRSADSLVLDHWLVHAARVRHAAPWLVTRAHHHILVDGGAAVLVGSHVLVENDVAVGLVRVFLVENIQL